MNDDTKALVERLHAARVRVFDLASGAREWTMRIPADHSDDDDLILGTALVEAADTIELLERELAEARRDANPCRASVDVVQTLPVPDDALPFTCCCCRQTHYMAAVSAKATPLRRPMSQGGGIVYDPDAARAKERG